MCNTHEQGVFLKKIPPKEAYINQKTLPPPVFDTQTVKPILKRYSY
jgi:hypothetical protein